MFILGPIMVRTVLKAYANMPMFTTVLGMASVFFIIIGIVGLIVAYGLWTGKTRAWWVYLILLVLGILSGLASLPHGILGIAINGTIIYYVTRQHVKAYFGIA
ncbi:hypothetical protein DRO97_02225 [Archaeoglobales archaeon]|nr:MAG: hypothetical protein DRO97_02225 [Archaeoglobales archaeon]